MIASCDTCSNPMVFRVYASYNIGNDAAVHPLQVRYPSPMLRTCAECLAGLLLADAKRGGSTKQWLVVAPEIPGATG